MPYRPKQVQDLPPDWQWVESVDDSCLYFTLLQAFVAEKSAVREGALKHPKCRRILNKARKTIESVRFAKPTTKRCETVASAIRKLGAALECAHPGIEEKLE